MSLSTFNFRSPLLVALILLSAVVATAEIYFRSQGNSPFLWFGKNPTEYKILFSEAVEDQRAGKKVVVLVGDSRVEWSVSPEVIEDKMGPGYKVYNLAYPGMAVREIMRSLVQAGFFPDVLVVGYSHLAGYWSKAEFFPLTQVKPEDQFNSKLDRALDENLVTYSPEGLKKILGRTELQWIGARSISPQGQARMKYRITYDQAVEEQHKWYKMMYEKTIPPEQVDDINADFVNLVADFKDHGTHVGFVKMPVLDWALQLENQHDAFPVVKLVEMLKVPLLDLNQNPEKEKWTYFDGIHIAAPDDIRVSGLIAEFIQQQVLTREIQGSGFPSAKINFRSGWSTYEVDGRWSNAKTSVMEIRAAKDEVKDLQLSFFAYRPQTVFVFHENHRLGRCRVPTQGFAGCTFRAELKAGVNSLRLVTTGNPSRPTNGDHRLFTYKLFTKELALQDY